jgi:hypothetical protein
VDRERQLWQDIRTTILRNDDSVWDKPELRRLIEALVRLYAEQRKAEAEEARRRALERLQVVCEGPEPPEEDTTAQEVEEILAACKKRPKQIRELVGKPVTDFKRWRNTVLRWVWDYAPTARPTGWIAEAASAPIAEWKQRDEGGTSARWRDKRDFR